MPQTKDFDLFKEFGLESLSEERKAKLQEQIMSLIESRYSRVILNHLSEADKKEMDKLLDNKNPEVMDKFIAKKVPDYADIYKKIIEDLKVEMLKVRDAIAK